MNKGEMWIIEVPNTGGHEQHGKRPAIIVADTKTSVVLVIPCTSNIEAFGFIDTKTLERIDEKMRVLLGL